MNSGIAVMALVCGILMIYFLTPLKREARIESQQHSKMNFSIAFKKSLVKTTFHIKAIFAFLLLLLTLIAIWWYHVDLEWYNREHGITMLIDPTAQAFRYMIAVTAYAGLIYFLLIVRRSFILLKKSL
ncbi:hypothetical protein KDN24_23825 [Bacillus sp. Bva_UNVM-123]|uniref:hypothetical protein n=1 Tax=Bacillus sp. Bva_UNVM-123 TaxID=2829798 RepID=UPI00391FC66B